MKRRIDPEQALSLDKQQQMELKRLWNPQKGDSYYRKDLAFTGVVISGGHMEYDCMRGEQYLPLFSVGQMIEILGGNDAIVDTLWKIIVEEKLNYALQLGN